MMVNLIEKAYSVFDLHMQPKGLDSVAGGMHDFEANDIPCSRCSWVL